MGAEDDEGSEADTEGGDQDQDEGDSELAASAGEVEVISEPEEDGSENAAEMINEVLNPQLTTAMAREKIAKLKKLLSQSINDHEKAERKIAKMAPPSPKKRKRDVTPEVDSKYICLIRYFNIQYIIIYFTVESEISSTPSIEQDGVQTMTKNTGNAPKHVDKRRCVSFVNIPSKACRQNITMGLYQFFVFTLKNINIFTYRFYFRYRDTV